MILIYNPGQKCWEGSITLEITPPPFQCWIFQEEFGDLSCMKNPMNNPNIEYGGARGAQEHVISQIVQAIVRIMELGAKWSDGRNFPNNFWPRL